MRKPEKPVTAQRRLWRMTPAAPYGEFVDPDEKPDKPAAPPAPDELREASWTRSSWDLLNGLEVTESASGDLLDELFGAPPRAASPAPATVPAVSSGDWVRRFALRLAELELQRDPRELIELAKRQWETQHGLAPEEAAEAEHSRPVRR